MKFKLWLWQFNFRMNHVRDDKKIEFLAKELMKEIEGQGYNLKTDDTLSSLTIYFRHYDKNKLEINNILAGWEIDCGTYKPKEDKQIG